MLATNVSKPFKMSAENLIDAISMKHIVDLLFVQLNFRIWQGNRTKNKKRVKKRGDSQIIINALSCIITH